MTSKAPCPIPHTRRDQAWLLIGLGLGYAACHYFSMKKTSTTTRAKPSVLRSSNCVVNTGEVKIIEHVGNASNGDAGISIAQVAVSSACDEAIQIPKFDEYVLVQSGCFKVFVEENSDSAFVLTAEAGEVLHLPAGHRYRYNFPGPCTYVPVCLPAFTPALSGRI